MRRSSLAISALQTGGFALHHYIGRLLNIRFLEQCCLMAALSAVAMLVGSILDGTLILPGRNIGLLQHPAIWAFIVIQVALPLAIRHSLISVINAYANLREIADLEGTPEDLVVVPLLRFVRLQDNVGKIIASIVYCCGLAAFVWNTYQNQLPGIIVPYDFWDSKNHSWAFWITRAYKLYLFGWLLPYISLIQIGIMVIILRLIKRARTTGKLKLLPFHPDGVGGFGFIPTLITTPILVTAVMTSIATAGAFEVHRALDITPLIGLALVLVSTLIAYGVPILCLRTDIVAIKRETIQKLRLLQQAYYSRVTGSEDVDFDTLKKSNEALEYFDKICTRIKALSNYPHFSRVFGYLGLILTPSAISITFKICESLLPVVRPLIKRR